MLSVRFKNMIKITLEDKRSSHYLLCITTYINDGFQSYSKKMYPILFEHVNHKIVFTGEGSLKGNSYTVIQHLKNLILCFQFLKDIKQAI